jgi:hypothetical protein
MSDIAAFPVMTEGHGRAVALRYLTDAGDWWVSHGVLFLSSDSPRIEHVLGGGLTEDERAAMVALAEWLKECEG